MSEHSQTIKNKSIKNPIEQFLIWLSTADSEVLADCPKWERLKYAAFGASLLVPFLFGMISASYAVSTLTDTIFIIAGFALVWGFIIITIDRALLATYRAFVPAKRKFGQFFLRMLVAVLMGLTVSHPLTLLLFKDTIHSEVERSRMDEMKQIRESIAQEKLDLDQKIQVAAENLQKQQQIYQDTLGGAFLTSKAPPSVPQAITDFQANKEQFADLDGQIQNYRNDRDRIEEDYNQWVATYENEVSGRRTGKAGVGPAARAIENDELVWRRAELKKLSQTLATLTQQRTEMSSALTASQNKANAQIASSRRQVEQQKLSLFKDQQGQMLAMAQSQIDAASSELERLRGEASQLTNLTEHHLAKMETESRADLMTQTLALHHLFEKPGGLFALSVYVVLASLFVLIDTIPLVVKFFAVPGIYDERLELKERSASNDKVTQMNRIAELANISNLSEIDDDTFKMLARKRDLVHSLINYQPQFVDPDTILNEVQSDEIPDPSKDAVPVAIQQKIDAPVALPPTRPIDHQPAAKVQQQQAEKFQSLTSVVPFQNHHPQVVEEDEYEDAIEFNEFAQPVVPQEPVPQAPVLQEPAYGDNQVFSTDPEPVLQPGFGEMVIEDPQERRNIMAQLQA